MKRTLFFILTITMLLLLLSCSRTSNVPMKVEDNMILEEEEIDYKVEQIIFSKSFQSIEPSVETLSSKNNVKILASLGLAEYSNVTINSVVKKGNIINIHVSGIKGENPSLSVPQIIMELSELNTIKDKLNFNIVFDDFQNLKIKFGINDIINKIQSQFKISSNRLPTYTLLKNEKNIVWDIFYKGVFDRENPIIPLTNLSVLIDANSGEILESEKVVVSSSLDNGYILDFIPEEHILYKKTANNNDSEKSIEQLWLINPLNKEKIHLYTTDYKISAALFNPDTKYISLIESNGDKSDLYIISIEDKRVFKVPFKTAFNPKKMSWKDKNTLYIIGNDEFTTTIFSYNIESNEAKLISKVNKLIDALAVNNNTFIITEKVGDEANKNIYLSNDLTNFTFIDKGFNIKFLSNDLVAYLKKDEKSNSNFLYIYNIKNSYDIKVLEGNISNYNLISDDEIVFVNQNSNNSDYTIIKYTLSNDTSEEITTIIGNKVYYDDNNNIIYLNITLPFDDNKSEMIYSIYVDKLNSTKNP